MDRYLKRSALILTPLLLMACSQGVNQAANIENGKPIGELLSDAKNPSSAQPSSRPNSTTQTDKSPTQPASSSTAKPVASSRPAASITSAAPSVTTAGRIPAKAIVNGSMADNVLLNDIQFLSSTLVTAAGSAGIGVLSEDGGRTWQQRQFNDDNVYTLTRRGDDIVAGRKGGIFVWDERSESWEILSTDIDEEVAKLTFFDEQNGIAVGGYTSGTLYKTSDGGESWTEAGNIPAGRNGTTGITIKIVDAATKTASIWADGVVYMYQDGDLQEALSGMNCCFGGVAFQDSQRGYAYSGLGGYETNDGGRTFETKSSIVLDGSVADMSTVRDMSFGSSDAGLLLTVGFYGSQQAGKLYFTRNGGKSWTAIKVNETSFASLKGLSAFVENGELIGLGYNYDDNTVYRIRVPL